MYIDVDVDVDLDIDVRMHTETFRNCARVLVPNYLPKPWQSRQNFWRCLEDPGMITNQKTTPDTPRIVQMIQKTDPYWYQPHAIWPWPFLFFFPECKFILPEVFWERFHHHRRDFSLKTRCSWRLFERDPGGSGWGMGVSRVTRWVCFHGGYSIHPGRKKENQLPSKASFFRLSCLSFRV